MRRFAYQPPKLSELFMEAMPATAMRSRPRRWPDEPLAKYLAGRPREILERGRSRGFVLSVLFTTLLVVGSSWSRPSSSTTTSRRPWASCSRPRPALEPDDRRRRDPVRHQIEITTFPDAASADAAAPGRQVGGRRQVPPTCPRPGEIRFKEETDQGIAQIISATTITVRAQAVLDHSDVDQSALAAAQQPPAVEALDPQTEADQARFLVANIGAVLILVGIFSFGFTVLTGVVEEKQSRVVEVVLSTVRARDLLMGKVLGIGVLGLVQLLVFVVAAIAAARCRSRLTLPTTTPGAVATARRCGSSSATRCTRRRSASSARSRRGWRRPRTRRRPVTMVAMISYFVALIVALNDPSGHRRDRSRPSSRRSAPLSSRCGRPSARSSPGRSSSPSSSARGDLGPVLIGGRVYAGAVLQTAAGSGSATRGGRPGSSVTRPRAALAGRERLEQAGRAARVPEDDRARRRRAVADAGDEPGQRLRRVDRVDEDPLGPGQQRGRRRRPPGSAGRSRRRAGRPSSRPPPGASGDARDGASASSEARTVGRSSAAGAATATPTTTAVGGAAGGEPDQRPACVPPVADGRTTVAAPTAPASSWSAAPARRGPARPPRRGPCRRRR